jgi:hypothetical protein
MRFILGNYQSANPSNGEVVRTLKEHTDRQMERTLATADRNSLESLRIVTNNRSRTLVA